MNIAFFGTPELAKIVLEELARASIVPNLILTNPDAKIGRKKILTPSPVAAYAEEHNIPTLKPSSLSQSADFPELTGTTWDLFVVVAYGKILPPWLLAIPTQGTINVHPSLLPKLRGASPIRSAILSDQRKTGVTIMLLDEKMDHGPILAQAEAVIPEANWPIDGQELDQQLATQGGQLLVETLPKWLAGTLTPHAQDHSAATFCSKISKDMSELAIDPYNLPTGHVAYDILLRIRAFSGWPETFFLHDGIRIKIKNAELGPTGTLHITRIVPAGKKELNFTDYFQ